MSFEELIMTKQSEVKNQLNTRERGVALLFCLFALLILTAVTASMILMTGTETSVNYNYRTEEIAFFAAKSGIYEALDRMQQSNAQYYRGPDSHGRPLGHGRRALHH